MDEATTSPPQAAAEAATVNRARARGTRRPVVYRESDGRPMAESEVHLDEMIRMIETVRDAFADRADVYVVGNLLLYYEEGNPRASVAPDLMVVKGVPKTPPRRVYKLWEEGAPPAVVLELTSRSTRREDLRKKWELYARLGVREYFLFDPLGEYLRPPLQGYRLEGGAYVPIAADADGSLLSDELDMRLALVDGELRLFDRRTGAMLLSPAERTAAEAGARRAAEEQAAAEVEARRAAEERAAAEAEARRAAEEQAAAEAEARRAAEERAVAEAEARRALEDRLADLEARLRRNGQQPPETGGVP